MELNNKNDEEELAITILKGELLEMKKFPISIIFLFENLKNNVSSYYLNML